MAIESLITDHLDLWTAAVRPKSSAGRGASSKLELTGIKKLRELILELAVRGKLVPQDPSDEPASVLLERIAAEKARLVKEGKIKKPKALAEIGEEEKQFGLPKGWEWCRINDVLHLENGDRSKNYPNKSALVENGIPFVNAGQLSDGLVSKDELCFISKERFDILNGGKFNDGDILFCLRGSLGKCAVVKNFGVGAIASSLVILRPYLPPITNYIMIVMNAPITSRNISKYNNGTAQPNLSAADLSKFGLPLPPLVEQHRIVAKVDELMALCDQLELRSESQLAAHQALVDTLLATLTDSSDADELAQNWARLSIHFDTLFTTEASIDALKQTILQLAVMGKLVPQDPTDEPASALLERIAAKKARLAREEGLRTSANEVVNITDEYIQCPNHWKWARLGNMAKFIDYRGKTPNKIDAGIRLITAKNIRYGYIDLSPEEFISEADYEQWMTRGFPMVGDILFTTEAPLGNAAIIDINESFALAQRAICFQWHDSIISRFMLVQILASPFQNQLLDNSSGMTATGVKASRLKEIPVAVPPTEEQLRIVARVDELMALCDQLKSRLQTSQQTQLALAEALVEQAL
ncbi:restriction endonuclease subunit S [Aeromonas caviae]